MKRLTVIYLVGFVFVFITSVIFANVDLFANPWLKTTEVNLGDLHLLSRPALLYHYLPSKFWLQTSLFSVYGPLWVIFVLLSKKSSK